MRGASLRRVMSELPPSGAALDKLLAGGGEAELRRRYAADLRAAGLGVPSGEFSMQQRNISARGRQQTQRVVAGGRGFGCFYDAAD